MVLDVFRILIRWLHLVAGVAWVGGSLFYLLVLIPVSREAGGTALRGLLPELDKRFREVIQLATAILIVSGVVITFDRLQLEPGASYVITLGIKVVLAVWMFVLAQNLASRGRRRVIERLARSTATAGRSPSTSVILGLGLVILMLSDVLKVIGPK